MHMFSVEKNFYGGHGIVAAQVSLGTGLAFANRYRDNDNVCLTYFGDGAANQGQVYESFNMAQLWKLPAIYIIENNQYAMGTSIDRSSSTTDLSQRGASFGIPGEQVDGMDVLAVRDAVARAVKRAREGGGPFILEMKTYRYRGHSMSDPAKYRTKEEVDQVKTTRDPIEQVRKRLIDKKWASEDDLKAMDKKVRDIVADATDFAQSDAEPDAFLDADGDGLLADVQVAEAADQAHAVELAGALLETADQHHLAIEAQQVLLGGRGRVGQLGRLAGISFGGGGFRHPSSPGWAAGPRPLVVTERGFSSLRSRKAKPPHGDVTKVHAFGVGPSVAAGAATRIT
jgi:2-oxoglutarate dehydrogenase complex dehydrogenase (E1) component-like enzyme